MFPIKTSKSALAGAVALIIGGSPIPQTATADITLTFRDNVSPSPTPLPFTAGSVAGASANLQFAPSTEFRVVTPYGSATNNGFKDAIFGGETWTFNNAGQLTAAGNTDPNPGATQSAPITAGLAGFPICQGSGTCPTIQRNASFLQTTNNFNFLAPILGSTPGNAYGAGTAIVDLTNNILGIVFPVTDAQWASGNYIIGNDPNRGCTPASRGDRFVKGQGPLVSFSSPVTITSATGAANITFDFVLHGESLMSADEVTVPGFCNNAVQWEFPGSASIGNQNPVAVDDGSVGLPLAAFTDSIVNINVLANDTDPDFALLNSTAFDTLSVATTGSCTNGGTLTNNTTNATYLSATGYEGPDSCTYTIADGRGGISAPATVFLNVAAAGPVPPTAVNDGPGSTPGGPYVTNQGVSVSANVLANDYDLNGDSIVVSRVDTTTVQGGTVIIINGGVEGGNNITYTPASGFNGNDSFTYDITDNVDGTDSATVQIQVKPFAESSAGTVTVSQRLTIDDIGVPDPESQSSCLGGCFSIEVQGVPSGGQIEVLLPKLTSGYQQGAVFREFLSSTMTWKAFEAPDNVQTAPGVAGTGVCPGISSGLWRTPTADDTCVKYSITDDVGTGNGPNDDDPSATIIVDPVGFGQPAAGDVKQENLISSSGCTINRKSGGSWHGSGQWLLVGVFIAFLRSLSKRRFS